MGITGIFLEDVGFQKPIRVSIKGIKRENIKNVSIEGIENVKTVSVDNDAAYQYINGREKGTKLSSVRYINNTKENCLFYFFDDKGEMKYDPYKEEEKKTKSVNSSPTVTTIGYIFISKLKRNYSGTIGIPFSIKITYNDNGTEKNDAGYFFVYLTGTSIGRQLSLPLYYRPFYFNSVLLLIPASFSKGNGVYFENDTSLDFFNKKTVDNTSRTVNTYFKVADIKITGWNTPKCKTTYDVYDKYKISNFNPTIKGLTMYLNKGVEVKYGTKTYNNNGEEQISIAYMEYGVLGDYKNITFSYAANDKITLRFSVEEKDSIYYVSIEKMDQISKNACYGRLFYSITNGCSIRDSYSPKKDIYKLNNITLSYVGEKNMGNMEIKQPFRCYSELLGYKDFKKTPDQMGQVVYGITEPFTRNDTGSRELISKTFYIMGGDATYRSMTVGKNVSTTGSQTRSLEWSDVIRFKPDVIQGSGDQTTVTRTEVKLYFRGNWKTRATWDSGLRHYGNTITFEYKVGDNGVYKEFFRWGYFKKRKRETIRNYPTLYLYKKGGEYYITGNSSDVSGYEHVTINWRVSYALWDLQGRGEVCVGADYAQKVADYKININRNGLPCCKDIKIDEYEINSSTCEKGGVLNIYDGEIIQLLRSKEKNVNILNKEDNRIIFDSSEWMNFSFKVEEGHPDGEEDYETAFVGHIDVKFYDDIELDKENKIKTTGTTSKKVRYFALNCNVEDITQDINDQNELGTIIESIRGFGLTTVSETPRYNGVNTYDYINTNDGKCVHTKNYGWKGIHTYLKGYGNHDVWLSGKENMIEGKAHTCLDITDELSLSKKIKQTISWGCGETNTRKWVIGVYDDYTMLDRDLYEEENNNMYSVVEKHTNRFAIIRLYCIQ